MRFFKRRTPREAEPRLLPLDAYPAQVTEAGRDLVDKSLREQLHTIPVIPGRWFDNAGDEWILKPDGAWTDQYGISRSSLYTPILSTFGPFTEGT